MQKISIIIGLVSVFFLNVFSPTQVFAQQQNSPGVCNFSGGTSECSGCMNDGKHVWTAFGCIATDPSAFLGEVLRIGIGIGGGVAFLLILFGGFQILTSAGNPEQLEAGRELASSAVTGLLLIILSIFLLRLIGVNILGIPGFT